MTGMGEVFYQPCAATLFLHAFDWAGREWVAAN